MSRLFEAIPALLAWGTIIGMFFFSYFFPVFVAVFIILFDIYWLLKTIFLSFHLRHTFQEMKKNLKINWLSRIKNLSENGKSEKNWEELYHLILFPFYKEPYEVIRESFKSVLESNYPSQKFILVLGAEERAGEEAVSIAEKIKNEFQNNFLDFLITVHPSDLPDEIPGKGSNETWMAQKVKELVIDKKNIPYENILVSVFDVDTQVLPEYFGILSYNFLTAEHPEKSSFQPIPLFTNNIFQAPSLARVVSFSTTFWQMMQQARPERLTTFSSHSMPFKALVNIGFWEKDLVSEDSRIFWQCLIGNSGDWHVVPLNYPVCMDANVASTFWGSMKNLYKQQRRWAWGSENVPYLLRGFFKNKKMPLKTKLYWTFNTLEGYHSWATNSLLIFALGWLPIYLGGENFNYSLLSYNLPEITRFIMSLASIGIVSSAIISILLLPSPPKWFKWWHYLLFLLQWALMPFTLIVFGSLPAIEAQTRLALGGKWRLGFWVTPKFRK
ncbi:MAG: glycosyltransferase family 2 protein [Candidatus Paceibacterota bacterium]